MLELNTIYNEDCLETMKRMPDQFVDLVITSPPYDNLREYHGFSFEFEKIGKELARVIKDGGVIVWIVGDETRNFCETITSFKQAIYFVDVCKMNLLDTMIWQKPNYAPGYPTLRRYDNVFEYMFIFSRGKPLTYNLICDVPKKESSKQRSRYSTSYIKKDGSRTVVIDGTENEKDFCRRTNVWIIPNGQERGIGHPAVFPVQLVKDHIISWSSENDIVYDPFIGSGTTAIAARMLGRRYIGSELSEKYCSLAEERIANYHYPILTQCLT